MRNERLEAGDSPAGEDLDAVRSLCWAGVVRGHYKYLRVTVRNGRVRVSVPLRVSHAALEQFIESNLTKVAQWVAEQTRANSERRRNNPFCADLRDGGHVAYLGRVLTLACRPEVDETDLSDKGETLIVRCRPNDTQGLPREVRLWLAARFVERLAERMIHWSRHTGLFPQLVKPSNACGRWGSCTRAGVVRVSWRTICLPPEVIDYVIVHELSHLKHFNHSPAFWETVRAFYPPADRVRAFLTTVRAEELA